MRHGNGSFITSDGISFQGQWINDVKHGRGKIKYADGETVYGFWTNDRLNGLAKVQKPGVKEPMFVIYKDDMMIMTNVSGFELKERIYCGFALVIMITCYLAAPLGFFIDQNLYFMFLSYIVYVIYSCCISSTRYIKNLVSLDDLF